MSSDTVRRLACELCDAVALLEGIPIEYSIALKLANGLKALRAAIEAEQSAPACTVNKWCELQAGHAGKCCSCDEAGYTAAFCQADHSQKLPTPATAPGEVERYAGRMKADVNAVMGVESGMATVSLRERIAALEAELATYKKATFAYRDVVDGVLPSMDALREGGSFVRRS